MATVKVFKTMFDVSIEMKRALRSTKKGDNLRSTHNFTGVYIHGVQHKHRLVAAISLPEVAKELDSL